MDLSKPETQRIHVDEIVVYETGEMDSFEVDFRDVVSREITRNRNTGEGGSIWVVVFSPTGCEGMLRVLGMGPFAGTDGEGRREDVFIATIGPTTRDFLRERFGFDAHVCAERPSAEGIEEGIRRFMDARR